MVFYNAGDFFLLRTASSNSHLVVYRYSSAGTFIETFDYAGPPPAGYTLEQTSIEINKLTGDIYVTWAERRVTPLDFISHVTKINAVTKNVSSFVTWNATVHGRAQHGLCFDSLSNLYVYTQAGSSGAGAPHVVKVDTTGTVVYDKLLGGTAPSNGGVAMKADNQTLLYAVSEAANEVVKSYNVVTNTQNADYFIPYNPPGYVPPTFFYDIQRLRLLKDDTTVIVSGENQEDFTGTYNTTVGEGSPSSPFFESGYVSGFDSGWDCSFDPDGVSIWIGSIEQPNFYKFTMATGVKTQTVTFGVVDFQTAVCPFAIAPRLKKFVPVSTVVGAT